MVLVWPPSPPLLCLKSEREDMLIVIGREASNLSQERGWGMAKQWSWTKNECPGTEMEEEKMKLQREMNKTKGK